MKYTEPGTYELQYTAVDKCGNEATQTREITVEETSEYPYTMCTIGAATIPAMQNGDAHTASPSINWLNMPPSDGKRRILKVYGENVYVMGESLSNPVGDGLVDDSTWGFHFNAPIPYYYEDMSVGGTEIEAMCYGDGHETGTESWDSLRIEVTGEE